MVNVLLQYLQFPDYLQATAALPNTPSYTSTLTASANGYLVLDVLNQGSDNGYYDVTAPGGSSSEWSMSYCSTCSSSTVATTAALLNSPAFSSTLTAGSNSALVIHVAGQANSGQDGYYTVASAGSSSSEWQLSECPTCSSASISSSAALPNNPTFSSTVTATSNGLWNPGTHISNESTTSNDGFYTLTNAGSSSSDGDFSVGSPGPAALGARVRVLEGVTNARTGLGITAASPTPVVLNSSSLTFASQAYDATLASITMMVPEFSPNGTKLIYVNGDADGDGTGWRRGLSMLSVNLNSSPPSFGNKTLLRNYYNAATAGNTIKWPFFEGDSRSVIYVQGDPHEFCPRQANYGQCDGTNCSSNDGLIDNDLERACYEGSYGNMSPTTRGYWYGKLHSLDSSNPGSTDTELAWLNSNGGALTVGSSGPPAVVGDANRAYQPTVLPFPQVVTAGLFLPASVLTVIKSIQLARLSLAHLRFCGWPRWMTQPPALQIAAIQRSLCLGSRLPRLQILTITLTSAATSCLHPARA